MSGNVFSIGNANADIVNIGGAATDVNLGSSAGVVNLVGNLKLSNNSLITVDDQVVMSWTAGSTADVTFDDNVTIGGTLTIAGSTIFNSGVSTADLLITVAKDAASVAATNGAGIKVDVANATITYDATNDRWISNKTINLGTNSLIGNVIRGSSFVATSSIFGNIATASQPNITSIGTQPTATIGQATIEILENDGDLRIRTASGSNGNIIMTTDGTGYLDFVNTVIRRPSFRNYREQVFVDSNVSGTYTPDWLNGAVRVVSLIGNVTSFDLPQNMPTGGTMTFILVQDTVGGRTCTFDAGYRFAFGSKTLSTAANSIDMVSIFYTGTIYLASLTKSYS